MLKHKRIPLPKEVNNNKHIVQSGTEEVNIRKSQMNLLVTEEYFVLHSWKAPSTGPGGLRDHFTAFFAFIKIHNAVKNGKIKERAVQIKALPMSLTSCHQV
ncbi:UNVERIFIED_CONTAM: hypothetical protein K2H54_050358 [Gekko kuhli]